MNPSSSVSKFKRPSGFVFKEINFINTVSFVFIALAGFEVLSGAAWLSPKHTSFYFFKDVVFLGLTHAGLTFFLLFELKPFKNFRAERNQAGGRAFRFELIIIAFFVLFFIYRFFHRSLPYNLGWAFIVGYTYYHQCKQHLGLFLEANRSFPNLESGFSEKMRSVDSLLLHSFILLLWMYTGVFHVSPFIDFTYIQSAFVLCLAAWGFSVYKLFGPQALRSKLIFIPRLLLYPLLPISFFAVIGTASVHGLEYFLVSKRLVSHEKNFSFQRIFSLGGFLCALTVILVIAGHFIYNAPSFSFKEPFGRITLSLLGAFLLLHHWLDGILFKMKDPLIRKHIGAAMQSA